MQIQFHGVDIDLGSHLKELVTEKLQLRIEKYLGSLDSDDLVLNLHITKDKSNHKLFAQMDLPGPGGNLKAQSQNEDLVVALKHLQEQLERQIGKFKKD